VAQSNELNPILCSTCCQKPNEPASVPFIMIMINGFQHINKNLTP